MQNFDRFDATTNQLAEKYLVSFIPASDSQNIPTLQRLFPNQQVQRHWHNAQHFLKTMRFGNNYPTLESQNSFQAGILVNVVIPGAYVKALVVKSSAVVTIDDARVFDTISHSSAERAMRQVAN